MLGNSSQDPESGSSGGDGNSVPEFEPGSGGGNRWPKQETVALIKIRTDMDNVFRDSSLKGPLWNEVSRKLAELGYNRSAKKCKEKFENVFKYHKRTKDGRATKSEGKAYRFFEQLEALDGQNTQPLPPPIHQATTQATPLLIAMPATNAVSSTQNLNQSQNQINIPQLGASNPFTSPPNPFSITPSAPNQPTNQIPKAVASFSSSSDDESEMRTERKRKWEGFFERLTSEVIGRQEEMQRRFLEALEKRENERVAREEAWRAQEQARINREREILAQERAVFAAKDAVVFAFLQKVSASETLQQINPSETVQQINIVQQTPPQPSEPVLKTPAPPQAPALVPAPVHHKPDESQAPVTTVAPQVLPPSQLQLPIQSAVQSMMKQRQDNGGEIVNFISSPSSSRWPKAEIEALIQLRTNLDLKYQENVPKGPLWEEISAGMLRLGYNRNPKRCKEKWENINKYYKKMKESNKKRPEDSKTCPYFSQLDTIYKERELHSKQQNMGEPIMAQPEQQWPVQNKREPPFTEGQDSDDEMEGDEDEENEGGNHELVAGYKKERIQIEVNQDGNRIAIIGERTVQEMVMLNWQMHRKEPERRGFRKAFNIPQGVNLDKIKARFDEDESCLTISMPKLVKGFLGLKIDEISEEHKQSLQKENENLAKENDESVTEVSQMKETEHREQVVDQDNIVGDEIPQVKSKMQELEPESLEGKDFAERKGEEGESSVQQQDNRGIENREQVAADAKSIVGNKISQTESEIQGLESDSLQETSIVDQEHKEKKLDGNDFAERKGEKGDNFVEQQANEEIENREKVVAEAKSNAGEKIPQAESEIQGHRSDSLEKTSIVDQEQKGKNTEGKDFSERKDAEGESSVEQEANEVIQSNEQESEIQCKEKKSRLCVPIIAGTAFIMSVVIVFVMHMVRANSAPSKKKN